MRSAFFKKWSYAVPDSWNEISSKNYLPLMKVFFTEYENDRGVLMLFRALAGIPWWQFFGMRSPNLIPAALDATEFLFKGNSLSKNLLPFYKGYAGPAEELKNLKMAEFCNAEFYYNKYDKEKKLENLDAFVAIIYRPKKSRWKYNYKLNIDGDFRAPFNSNTTGYHQKRIAKWPTHVKLAIFHFYQGARATIIARNPKVFDNNDGGESLYGLWSIMRSVAKGGHMGDIDKVADQFVGTVLMELNETVVEAERIEMERNKVTVER
jgi:hypothetical protein